MSTDTKKDCGESGETTFSLLEKPNTNSKHNSNRRKCIARVLISWIFIIIFVTVLTCICVADYWKPTRCKVTDTLGYQLVECAPVATLESLTSPIHLANSVHSSANSSIPRANMTACTPQTNGSAVAECADIMATSQREQEYQQQAEEAWTVAYRILHDKEGWHHYKGSSLKNGRVYTKTYEGIGRVSKLQVHLKSSHEQLQMLLIDGMDEFPSWYHALEDVKILERFGEDLTVVLMVAKAIAGGLVAGRDFLDVSYWKRVDNMTLVAQAATTHPDMPERKGYVRGFHKAGGMMFQPVQNKPGTMLLEWAFAMDVNMWLPGFLLDQAQASSMLEFTAYVKDKLKRLNRQ